jgi:hypothetical protein
LRAPGLHRQEGGRWGFYPPPPADPGRLQPVWQAITDGLGERQARLPEIYARLAQAPYGVKLGVLPVLITAYLLAHRREVALYREEGFCETLTLEELELLCRRPELFALERFDLTGLRGELFDQYLRSIVGKVQEDATLLDIVRPLMRFISAGEESGGVAVRGVAGGVRGGAGGVCHGRPGRRGAVYSAAGAGAAGIESGVCRVAGILAGGAEPGVAG